MLRFFIRPARVWVIRYCVTAVLDLAAWGMFLQRDIETNDLSHLPEHAISYLTQSKQKSACVYLYIYMSTCHYENTPMQYTENVLVKKMKNFHLKKSDVFLFLLKT